LLHISPITAHHLTDKNNRLTA